MVRAFFILFMSSASLAAATVFPPCGTDGPSERAYEVAVLTRVADPVLAAASEGKLKERLPGGPYRSDSTVPLEALGRTLSGIAPWLELGPGTDAEGQLRTRHIDLALKAIRQAVDPESSGFMDFNQKNQALVDAAFLAQALLRAPKQLWGNLDEKARAQVVDALRSSRAIKPGPNNWELFSATVEATLLQFTGQCDMAPIEKAVNDHLAWYKGDGTYGDGAELHWDYYNSFVIQPMLWLAVEVCAQKKLPPGQHIMLVQERARRYAEVQERMISPEGAYPIIGRSSTYRFGAFQLLSFMAWRHELPASLPPASVRSALHAVIHRVIEAPNTFDEQRWLRIGVVGAQPKMADGYITPGSVYLCTFGLLQLGLPSGDPYWTGPDEAWTQKRLWSGEDLPGDHALHP